MQKLTHKQLQREATQRLNEFMGQIRNQSSVDLSAKNLGEEGCAYVAEALAFNDRCSSHCNASRDNQNMLDGPHCLYAWLASLHHHTTSHFAECHGLCCLTDFVEQNYHREPLGNSKGAVMPFAETLILNSLLSPADSTTDFFFVRVMRLCFGLSKPTTMQANTP